MKRIAVIVWNLFVIVIIVLAVSALLPKIQNQFKSLDRLSPGPLRDWTEAMGFIGLGILFAIICAAVALSSPFWGRIACGWRILFGLLCLAFVCGTIAVIGAERAFMHSVDYPDYITFLGFVGLFLLPPVIVGFGIPYMTWRWLSPIVTKKLPSNQSEE